MAEIIIKPAPILELTALVLPNLVEKKIESAFNRISSEKIPDTKKPVILTNSIIISEAYCQSASHPSKYS